MSAKFKVLSTSKISGGKKFFPDQIPHNDRISAYSKISRTSKRKLESLQQHMEKCNTSETLLKTKSTYIYRFVQFIFTFLSYMKKSISPKMYQIANILSTNLPILMTNGRFQVEGSDLTQNNPIHTFFTGKTI
jgi:hypothetical protein